LLITGLPFLIPSKTFRCFHCGKDFQEGKAVPAAAGAGVRGGPGLTKGVALAALIGIVVLIVLLS
jgi:hypothetical protein